MKLPHDLTAEQAVLGAIIIDPDKLPIVMDYIPDPDMFHSPKHQQVYTAMLDLFNRSEGIGLVEVAAKTGNMAGLMELANTTPTSANAENYARIVKEKAVARRLVKACYNGMTLAADESQGIDERVAAVEAELYKASEAVFTGKNRTTKELAKTCMMSYGEQVMPSIKSGFYDLDNLITGFRPGELVIVAGRTSMGKTTLALNIAGNIAAQGIPVQIFSLEMTAERVTDRLICVQGNLPGQVYRQGKADIQQVQAAAAKVYELPIFIYDRRVSTPEIRAKCMRIKNLGLVVVDFITLIKDKRINNASTADHVGEIAKRLQEIAKELRVPFLVLSQMNRQVESREDKTPRLSDLRESGNIEEAADTILFLHRPDYYDRNVPKTNTAEVIIAKQRDGPTGSIELGYFDYVPTFRNK